METGVFPKQSIRSRFSKMIYAELFVDKPPHGKDNRSILRQYGKEHGVNSSLPSYVLLDKDGNFIASQSYLFPGSDRIEKFAQFLDKALK